jgi:hypothetical protein
MENVTLGQIALGITFLVTLISGIAFLHKTLKKFLSESLGDQFFEINVKIDSLQETIDGVDMNHTKNFLVRVLSDIEQGNKIDEVEKERFSEQFDHYCEHGGNSYIRAKVEKLRQEGKL